MAKKQCYCRLWIGGFTRVFHCTTTPRTSNFLNWPTSSSYRHYSGKRVWIRKHSLPIHLTNKWLGLNTMVRHKLVVVLCSTWYSKMEQGVTIHLQWMVQWSRGMTTSYHRTTRSPKSSSTTKDVSMVSVSIWVMDLSGTLVDLVVICRLWQLTSQTTKWLLDSKPNQTLGF